MTIPLMIYACIAFVAPTSHHLPRNSTAGWTPHAQRPDDPSLSCYLEKDGLWRCRPDSRLHTDPDDSY